MWDPNTSSQMISVTDLSTFPAAITLLFWASGLRTSPGPFRPTLLSAQSHVSPAKWASFHIFLCTLVFFVLGQFLSLSLTFMTLTLKTVADHFLWRHAPRFGSVWHFPKIRRSSLLHGVRSWPAPSSVPRGVPCTFVAFSAVPKWM